MTIVGQGCKFLIQILNLAVLSRILSPKDFGIVAMVMAVVGLSEVIRDFGLSSAAVQSKTLSHLEKCNLFWINALLGLVLSLAVVACAPLVATLYNEPRLKDVTMAVAITFLLNGLQAQFQAELGRRLRFFALTWTDVLAAIVGFLAAVAAATNNYGYWALVWQQICQMTVLLLLRLVVSGWRPGLPSRSTSIRRFLRYGWNLMLTQTLVYFSSNIDRVLIGARWGAASVGLYSRAFQLLTVPLSQLLAPLTAVALPVMSRAQDNPKEFNQFVLRSQAALGHLSLFSLSFTFGCADALVNIVLGDRWGGVSALFKILVIGGAFQVVAYPAYWVFLAKGLTGSHFKYALCSRSLMIVLLVVGSYRSPEFVALGYTVSLALAWPVSLLWISRAAKAPSLDMLRNGLQIILLGAAAAAIASWAAQFSLFTADWQKLLASAVMCTAVYALAAAIFTPIREDFRNIASIPRIMRGRN